MINPCRGDGCTPDCRDFLCW